MLMVEVVIFSATFTHSGRENTLLKAKRIKYSYEGEPWILMILLELSLNPPGTFSFLMLILLAAYF